MIRPALSAAAIAAAAALAVAVPGASAQPAAPPVAHAAATCTVPADGHGWGPTYVTRLTVKGATCAAGTKVVKAYYTCRTKGKGPSGRCVTKVLGYACTEKRTTAIPTQFDASVSCRKGTQRVDHTYTQFT